MKRHQLSQSLQELHEELSRTDELDAETRDLLHTVTNDIHRILDQSGEIEPEHKAPATHGLQEILIRFEGRYPRLAAVIEQVTDGLANLGI